MNLIRRYYIIKQHCEGLIRETTQIAENAYGDVENIDAFIDETEKTILKVTQDRSAGEFKRYSRGY
ncbi:MAG: hypothetical protein V8R63_02460 [Thomasclavelia ramosa]